MSENKSTNRDNQRLRWSTTPLLDALKSPEPSKVMFISEYPTLSY